MPISSHSHSGQFCLHAQGTLEQVILEAIQQGFHTFSFTEHCPRKYAEDLYPEESHLTSDDLFHTFDEYIQTAKQLREKYADKIQILIGSETEYIRPDSIDLLRELVAKYDLDYLVGSVHHVNAIPIDFSVELWHKALEHVGGCYEKLFLDYFDHQYTLLTSLQPLVVAHFDLICLYANEEAMKVFTNSSEVWKLIERNIEYVNSYGGVFEINTSAFRKGWSVAYPKPQLIKLMQKHNSRFTLSDDSHGPHQVGLNYHRGKEYLEKEGIHALAVLSRNSKESPTTYQMVSVSQIWSNFVGKNGLSP
ncbi:histidinol-phosphatase [Schizosaccharomyces octosporus yFS286]|uniref:Histidinol-phosphatase n=1 Tax=Schizosaccharomyces octosporus (strain yFS286) TaxID=483514 RepID=S9R0A3_SCHOY|nr:histidinol-phosphatase [Schizosaccharomyces octosporus yFS286]EPX71910.1 histidinol-phosphatase [Schizosaccharomyces octosporus yFS286]